jgi:hypothetical protein
MSKRSIFAYTDQYAQSVGAIVSKFLGVLGSPYALHW